ncbi:MAG: methyl-accepting chemotaxis protein [Bacillota bacterium]|nr:methyl-accepting chemotaxis protein [Bacillota bacterium]
MKLRLRWKITFVFAAIIVLLSLGSLFYSIGAIRKIVGEATLKKLKGDLTLGYAYLNGHFPGPWAIREGKLYKGNTLMNENFAVVDAVGSFTGDTVTIFQSDTRVATNVLKEGRRAVGTRVDPEVARTVLKEGRTYFGEADVAGIRSETAYQPIKDSKGETIGIWYVGVPIAFVNEMVGLFVLKMGAFYLTGLVVLILVSWLFSGYICRPIQKLGEAMDRAGGGDLTVRTNFKFYDEIGMLGQQFDRMLEMLGGLFRKVVATGQDLFASASQLNQGAEEATRVTEQIATTIAQVAGGADNQAKSIEEVSHQLTEMTRQVQQVARNSQTVASASEQAEKASEGGREAIARAVSQMNTINETVTTSAETVKKLGKRSQEIGQIVQVITGIADQTNLLALNAAIEAARAGEQGRGFAVVADEVRKLAEQSAEAANEIALLIKEIQAETGRAVQAMEVGTGEVRNGIEVVQQAGIDFNEISSAINNVSQQIAEVAVATQKMTRNADQAAAAAANVAAVAQETAASSEEVAAATEQQTATMEQLAASINSLFEITNALQEYTARFKL